MRQQSGEIMDERTYELTAAGMVAEIEMRAAIASGDWDAMVAWVRRGSEIRSHLRALHLLTKRLSSLEIRSSSAPMSSRSGSS